MPFSNIILKMLMGLIVFAVIITCSEILMLITEKNKIFFEGAFTWGIVAVISILVYRSLKKLIDKPRIVIDFDKEINSSDFKELEEIVKNLSEEGKTVQKTSGVNPVRKSKRYELGKTTEEIKLIVRKNHQEHMHNIAIKNISKGGMYFWSNCYLEGNEKHLRMDIPEKFENVEILFVRKEGVDHKEFLYGYGIKFPENMENSKRMDIINFFKEKYILDKE